MTDLELYLNLKIDCEPPSPTTVRSEKTNQILSFTFSGSHPPITIQYTENLFLESGNEAKQLNGSFFLESQPFQLFHLSESRSYFNTGGNYSKTELVPVDTLPCTALISRIQKSNYQINLLQSDPNVFSGTLKDQVLGGAYIQYKITYCFNLESLITTCHTSTLVDTST
jgi:hypothetical protein